MQHLNEGIIHAWLDNALSEQEVEQVARHVSECPACAAIVAEARGLIAASSRILGALDVIPGNVLPGNVIPGTVISTSTPKPTPRPWYMRSTFRASAALATAAVGIFWVIRTQPPTHAVPSNPAATSQATTAASAPNLNATEAIPADSSADTRLTFDQQTSSSPKRRQVVISQRAESTLSREADAVARAAKAQADAAESRADASTPLSAPTNSADHQRTAQQDIPSMAREKASVSASLSSMFGTTITDTPTIVETLTCGTISVVVYKLPGDKRITLVSQPIPVVDSQSSIRKRLKNSTTTSKLRPPPRLPTPPTIPAICPAPVQRAIRTDSTTNLLRWIESNRENVLLGQVSKDTLVALRPILPKRAP